jgi:UDPglucose 6-dehydrogenase
MISFVGLGKLGLPLATCFAKAGVRVLAIDTSIELIGKLTEGEVPWFESDLQENIQLAKQNISYSFSYQGVSETRQTVILVNTPSIRKDGSFSTVYVEQALINVCRQLHPIKNSGHLFVLSSTVMPGTINKVLVPLVENLLPWKMERGDFGFSFVPDFVALGSVIHDFHNPDFLMIGSSSEKYLSDTEILYRKVVLNGAALVSLTLPEAELAKVALNAFLTTKISFSNFLKLYCDRAPQKIDARKVAAAIGCDSRIGSKYLKPGAPYGGTCFPRDTWAFNKAAIDVGLEEAWQMTANEKINDKLVEDIVVKIVLMKAKKVCLAGLSFKRFTSVCTESMATKLYARLSELNFEILCWDPSPEACLRFKSEFPDSVFLGKQSDVGECDVVVECLDHILDSDVWCKQIIKIW